GTGGEGLRALLQPALAPLVHALQQGGAHAHLPRDPLEQLAVVDRPAEPFPQRAGHRGDVGPGFATQGDRERRGLRVARLPVTGGPRHGLGQTLRRSLPAHGPPPSNRSVSFPSARPMTAWPPAAIPARGADRQLGGRATVVPPRGDSRLSFAGTVIPPRRTGWREWYGKEL